MGAFFSENLLSSKRFEIDMLSCQKVLMHLVVYIPKSGCYPHACLRGLGIL
ncbi:MAG: hypothetical protein K0Q55_1537 [Verrucomicrobia bacterium]|jgi:hypothetical protein|nr:hypothetical protein [Verrucomicrobiota bacterium]